MSDLTARSWPVGRRDFLKLAASTGAGVTLGAYLRHRFLEDEALAEHWGDGPGVESWRLSICKQCAAGCGLRVRIVDGDARKLDGNPLCPVSRGALCPKGQAGLQALYDADRWLGPVRRSGNRGANQWERIGWDDALAEVQTRLGRLRVEGRPEAVAWIAERDESVQGQLIRRFMRAYGSPNLYEFVDLRDEAARAAAWLCQGIDEFPAYDLEKTTYILSFGTSLLEAWLSPTWMARQFGHLRRGRPEHRGRFVHVGPRLSPTAAKADEWIPIQPGTEAALALAIAHVLIREDLYDRTFVEEHTFGFGEWTDSSGSEREGFRTAVLRDYAPGDVSGPTGVPVTTILRLAREIAANRPALAIGEQEPFSGGIPLAWAVHALNALNGMVERPGGVLAQRKLPLKPLPELALDQTAGQGLSARALPPLAEAIASREPYPLEVLFVSSGRFLAVSPEAEKFFRATGKIPFIVSFSTAVDDTASFADLILPDHSPLERWQDAVPLPVSGVPVWAVVSPALPPLLDTRSTGEVVMDVGRRLGGSVGEAFPWKELPEVLRLVAEGLFESRRGTPFTTPYESAWNKQLELGGWWVPSAKTFEEFWQHLLRSGGWWDPVYFYEHWQRAFRTPSGRFEFVSQTLAAQPGSASGSQVAPQPLLPTYVPPQWLGDEREFPLKLNLFTVLATSGLEDPNQPFLQETLSPLGHVRWHNGIEVHPETARGLGITDGDWVWIESPRGKLRLRARAFSGAMPDVVSVLLGHEHRSGGGFVTTAAEGVADLVAYRPDPSGLGAMAVAASTRVRIYKA